MFRGPVVPFFLRLFFFNDTATTEIYTLSLHDALPISRAHRARRDGPHRRGIFESRVRSSPGDAWLTPRDRKSTRLNSSHSQISYAVFCLKKKSSMSARLCEVLHRHPRHKKPDQHAVIR